MDPTHSLTHSLTDPHRQSVLRGLLEKNPDQRLGGGARDGKDVMSHPFFAAIDFNKLVRREIKPSFIPVVTSEIDASNFDPTFTTAPVQLTPPSPSTLAKDQTEAFSAFEAHVKK